VHYASEQSLRGKRVLVIDDEPLVREIAADALSYEGYDVCEAFDGVDALHKVENTEFDLILLDLWMPRMDGWSFLAHYAALPGPHARVIVCTAVLQQDAAVPAMEVAGYLQKPFGLDELYTCVQRFLN
jgi:CheY-like chemotaxis protein